MDDVVNRFAADLAADVEEAVEAPGSHTASAGEMFTQMVLERLEEAGHLQGAFDLYQEGQFSNAAYRIDGFAFDEDTGHLDLFTTLHLGEVPPGRVMTTEIARAAQRALRFATAALDGLADRLEPSNTDASDLARRIQAQADAITRIRVILLTDGRLHGALPATGAFNDRPVEYQAYDIVRLHRVLGEGETRSDITVDLQELTGAPIPCLRVAAGEGGYTAYLAVLPGEILSKIYDRYGVRLLELNVRAFLGIQGRKSVNAELRRTITEQPAMFLAFNNGLVATVDSIDTEIDDLGRSMIRRLHGLQIVNGGQTTASLHRARRKERLSLEHVEVPVKIIHVNEGDLVEMVGSVSRAANRQNAVQLADFSANDPFHQQVETLANNAWLADGKGRWFYERARGAYSAAEQKASLRKTESQAFRLQTPKSRRLGKLDLARHLAAWDGLPHRVCLGGQKNFQHFMQRLKDEKTPAPDAVWFHRLVALTILYRTAERIVRLQKLPAYRAQIVAYLVAGLSLRTGGRLDFERIWSHQAVSWELETLIGAWVPAIDAVLRESAGQKNPGEWFKKIDCWDAVKSAIPALVDPLPEEIAHAAPVPDGAASPSGAPSGLSAADFDLVSRAMAVTSMTWLSAAEMGQTSGVLHWRVAGICRTLASYAAGGWSKKPSPKQAKHGLEALRAVEEAHLLAKEEEAAEA